MIFDNYNSTVTKWVKLGDEQHYLVKPSDDISFRKSELGTYGIVCRDTCFNKYKFSIPLAADVHPYWETNEIQEIVGQAYIKCDMDGTPIVEGGKNIITARVIRYVLS